MKNNLIVQVFCNYSKVDVEESKVWNCTVVPSLYTLWRGIRGWGMQRIILKLMWQNKKFGIILQHHPSLASPLRRIAMTGEGWEGEACPFSHKLCPLSHTPQPNKFPVSWISNSYTLAWVLTSNSFPNWREYKWKNYSGRYPPRRIPTAGKCGSVEI